jgi:hypothetical protein
MKKRVLAVTTIGGALFAIGITAASATPFNIGIGGSGDTSAPLPVCVSVHINGSQTRLINIDNLCIPPAN